MATTSCHFAFLPPLLFCQTAAALQSAVFCYHRGMNKQQHPAIELMTELLSVPAPSGREERLAQLVRNRLDQMSWAHETDGAGNVLVRVAGKQPEAPLVCYAAHMDEIGMVVTSIGAYGTRNVARPGGLLAGMLGYGRVEIVGDGETVVGLLSMGSTHGKTAVSIDWAQCHVKTGLTPDQLSEKGVRVGSTAVPITAVRGPHIFGDDADPLVAAWTFDDRLGVVTLLRLLEAIKVEKIEPQNPTIIAFVTQEEVGGLGAKALARREKPYVFIAIDGSPIPPGTSLALDGSPGIWSKDRLCHYDQALIQQFLAAGTAVGTEVQPAAYDATTSDAGMVFAVGLAERVACFGHVRGNSHGYEVCRFSVFDNVLNTLKAFFTTFKQN